MPREHFKSTVCSVALPLWLLIHDRNTTIALISAVDKNTKKWLRQIKHIIQYNKWFRTLFPEIRPADKWDETEIEIVRDISLSGQAQASITASSITSGQASQHYQHIILDDPVNEKVAQSEKMLETAVELYKYLESLLKDWEKSTMTLVGTPYGRGDVLEYAMEHDVRNGERLFWGIGALGEFQLSPEIEHIKEIYPVYNEGEPIFPEECPSAKLEHLRKQDVEVFYLQYLCKPYDLGRNGFDLDLIRDIQLLEDGYTLRCDCHPTHVHDLRKASVIATWDPAATEDKKNCRAAIMVMAQFPCGCRVMLDSWLEWAEPDKQINQMVEFCHMYYPYLQNIGVETVGLQKTLKSWLEVLQNDGKIPAIVTIHPLKPGGRDKDARIKSQQAPVANGLWHKRPGMAASDTKRNWMWELEGWPYRKERDGIDAGFGYCEDLWDTEEGKRFIMTDEMRDRKWNDRVEQQDDIERMKELA